MIGAYKFSNPSIFELLPWINGKHFTTAHTGIHLAESEYKEGLCLLSCQDCQAITNQWGSEKDWFVSHGIQDVLQE